MSRKLFSLSMDVSLPDTGAWPRLLRALLPSPGNVLFTVLVVGGLLWASNAGALPPRNPAAAGTSTGTIAYQGRLADADGNPLTGTYNMIFRLYAVVSGGAFLWEEQWTGSNGVQVSDGLFNVMLGSLTQIPVDVVTGHDMLWLGITVGTDDEMTPRVQLGSVPFAMQSLTVLDGSVTTQKIADGAVTTAKLNLVDGNVGIGTTNPTAALHLASRSNEFPSYHMQKITYDDTGVVHSGQTLYGLKIDTNFAGSGNPTNIGLDVDVSGSGTATRYAALFNGGNVGIGTTTPQSSLHVNGAIEIGGSQHSGFKFSSGLQQTNNWRVKLLGNLQVDNTVGGDNYILGSVGIGTTEPRKPLTIRAQRTGEELIGFEDPSGTMKWHINQNPGGNKPGLNFVEANVADGRLFIQAGGNVGIGTTSPSERLHVMGNILASGSKSAVVSTEHHGQRKLYAFEQASNRFGDEGQARLVNGVARVNVDPIFLETIEGDFLIHVTPYGDASLYVAEVGEDSFVVRARKGSDDVAFAWMLTAARKGYGGVRLEEVE